MTVSPQDAHEYPIYGARFRLVVPLLDADGDPVSPSSPDTELSQDMGTFADATNEATEIATSSGIIYVDLIATELDTKSTVVRVQSTGAKTTVAVLTPRRLPVIRTGTAQAGAASTMTLDSSASAIDDYYTGMWLNCTNDTPSNVRGQCRKIVDYVGSTKVATIEGTWGTTVSSSTTFEVLLPADAQFRQSDLSGILGTAVSTPATAGILDVNVKNIDNDAASASGTVTFPNATIASTTNITAGTVTTATNVTTVNGLAASVITATSIAADAITAAKVADGTIDAATFAASAINAAAIAADAITAAKIADGAIDAATFAAGAINAAAIATDAITAAKIAADAIGASELAADAVTEIQSGLATSSALTNVQSDLDDIQLRIPAALTTGTADSGTTTTMVDAALTQADTDYWKGCMIRFTSGTISGQVRLITGFTPASDTITFSPATTQAVGTNTYEILPAADKNRVILVDTLTTYTGNTPQTGDSFARIGATGTGLTSLASATQATNIQADTDDIQARLPAALVSGRIDSSVGAMAANVLTATAINADAITAAKVAADVTTEIQSGLATAAALDAVDNFLDTEIAAIITTLGTPAGASISADLLTIDNLVDDLESRIGTPSNLGGGATVAANLADIEAQTDDIGAAGAGLTALATQASVNTIDDFIDTEITTLTTMLTGIVPVNGTIGATGNDTTHLHLAGLAYADDGINSMLITIKDVSTGLFYSRWVEDFANTGDLATVGTLPFTPEASVDLYWVLPVRADVTGGSGLDAAGVRAAIGLASANLDTQIAGVQSDTNDIQTRVPAALVSGRIDASVGAMAANTLTASALATDAVTEIQSGLSTLNAAQVNTEVDTAIADARLDELLSADSDIDGAAPPTVGSVFHELMSKTAGAFTFDQTTDSNEALRDRGDAAWVTATGFSTHSAADVWAAATRTLTSISDSAGVTTLLSRITVALEIYTAAHVRSAVGLASANLDTQLTAIDDAVDSEVAAIISTLATILAAVDTEIAAIKAKTDNLPSDPADQSAVEAAILAAWTTALTEAYRGAGATGTPAQLLYELLAHLGESSISGTTKTLKKLDGSTTAKTYTLNSSTVPTSITETT